MKKPLLTILPLALIIIIGILIVPYLLNSPRGNKAVLSKISQNINYNLEVDRLYFSWAGPQRVKNLTAVSPSGVRYYFPELSLPLPLWKLWKKNPFIGITRVSNLIVTMPSLHEKPVKELKPDCMISPTIKCPCPRRCIVFGEVHVTNGSIYLGKEENPIHVPKLQYICTPERIALHVDAIFPNTTELSHMDMECTSSLQDVQIKARDVPTYLLDQWKNFSSPIPLQEIVGSVFHIDARSALNHNLGPISFDITSPTLSIKQSGELSSNHYVLDKPFMFSLQFSKEALRSLFYHPIIQIEQMEERIRVNIPPQEIFLPLSLSSEVNNASIYIGKITCMNKDWLFHLASEILHIDDSNIDIWFSEIPVDYSNGIFHLSRSEILIQNKYQFAIWGNIDCVEKKVRLKLGIPESTLRKVFGIKSLPPNCMITCSIKGDFDDIQLDTSKLLKKISILLAKEKAKKEIWKEGSKFFKDSTDIPQPIQSLPWEKK